MVSILALGSNVGERRVELLTKAIDFLEKNFSVLQISPIYESADCHGTGCRYMNAVAKISTELTENELNPKFKAFELSCGRDEESRKRGEVPVDIDIVVTDGRVRRPADYAAAYFRRGLELLGGQ